ncbi:hypothetical protein FHT77_000933 [Rhizobium sp. BK181]|uniref:hypothetical protein n=1 Tax=Rhizobium sp. BK181 TaxID=2587072 RepID=UPI00160CA0A5|nr:hypothetical protein [Rhizobium sp. BK181]MBB3315091.1 hypothetical protein [Rhizobium sp. BK181]
MIDGYHREKFSSAVDCLVGLGDIRQRVEAAFVALATVKIPELLEDVRADYDALHKTVTAKPAQIAGEGTIRSTLRQMTDEEVADVSGRILEIHNALLAAA